MSEFLPQLPTAAILGLMFFVGLAADLIGRFTFLPRVTLLLLGGLAIGPVGMALLPDAFVDDWFSQLTTIALALIGFLLGQQVSVRSLQKRGARVIGISLCKVLGAALAVGSVLLLMGTDPVVAVLLAGIAPATDPAATYDVVRETDAEGDIVDTLLSIVAIDDMWGLMIFMILAVFAGTMAGDATGGHGMVSGLHEIGGSFALGIAMGVPMAYLTGRIRHGEPTLVEGIGFVLLGAGVAEMIGMSPILTAMAMGATVASLAKHHERPFNAIEGIEWPFMILFFVLAGASLDVGALRQAGAITAFYILARCAGIYLGARTGSRLLGADLVTRRWLGVMLFPQAGVAIGMALLASQRFPEMQSLILPTVLASTIFLEVVAPIITRQALRKAGAIDS